ncbi:hypothetical protein Mal15_04910 [Stieleria maiorica]|uniref:DUF1552 domain-containing protein n=1 Tax=Stieleria maiorica TaxID=2795974 RepID=A0A5B9M716_9BACT|nr:DUF1552 domain-containing protein [Stieleria maiorica]QEF96463.1 hypothetical protein Mal15_04910 [Stieleria maiorica]
MRTSEPTLPRRRILTAAGYTIALPMFASLRDVPFVREVCAAEPERSSSDTEHQLPKRFCCIFFPNGVSLPPAGHPAHDDWHWFPHREGRDYVLTRPLEPLANYRDELTILSGLSHPAMRSSIAHLTADSFLTGADSSREYTNSISLDQLIAKHLGAQTRFPSLTLSSDGGVGTPGRTQTLSFSASGRPIPSLSQPRAIFNRLFGVQEQTVAEQRRRFGRDQSILDNVLEETATLGQGLSAGDRRRLDEYTTSVREIEKRLASSDRWLDVQRPNVDPADFELAATPHDDVQEYIRVIYDLMYVAFLTDSTRSITYQITSEDAKGIGDRFPSAIGLPGHHSLSHGTGKENGYENWARYDQFLTTQFAYFIERLRSTSDPFQQGSLLDHSCILYGCSTSRTHQAVNYPLILAGGKAMGFSHGTHKRFDESRYRLSDLYVTLLQQFGIEADRFADSTTSLSEVLGV